MTSAILKTIKKYRVEILLILILVFALMILKRNIVEKFQGTREDEEEDLRNRLSEAAGASLS
tara:strand:+ start:235 stop:420 length:186 start_codon:yes stop_codon:yes gene_type:complete